MRIAIDLGHGVGQDRGAVGLVSEENIINEVGSAVIEMLRNNNIEVVEVRPSQATTVANSLVQRVDKANNSNVDLYMSIHANAGGGRGSEIFTFRGTEHKQAKDILANLSDLGFINRGVKGSSLYVVNNTAAKAMLVEICFVDTSSDVALYKEVGAYNIAKAIVDGILDNTIAETITKPSISIDNWISRLQKECNAQGFSSQTVDGIAGNNTLKGCPMLKQGAQGNITKLLQEKLKIIQDGIFGINTKEAVMAFQINNGLTADGIVGQNTWRKLLGLQS